jgi:signal transduction histidine kinase/CheY-like chemotaxis protein
MPDQRADAAALLLSGMQFAVFERLPEGTFVGINAYPDWFLRLVPNSAKQDPATSLTEYFPALEGFLPVAEEFWEAPSSEQLQSDFWTETDADKHEYHLLALALTTDSRHFLVMERADVTYIEHQQLQLYAHEMVIQYDTIARLNKEVERATQAKSDFLANMSHEMRTPLNAILGMADLLAETALNDVQRKYVDVFQRAGANLLGLINDILDLSKVEAGQMELELVDFDLADVVRGVLDLTRGRTSVKGIEVGSVLADGLPSVLVGDPLRLRQILLNLLGNAMKFTESGRLDVEVDQDPDDGQPGALLFRVKDTGIGIPKDKLASIFENFSQADSSTTRKYGGTGLGLAISKRLVDLMGGRIWVESTVGQGSTFLFTAKLGVSEHSTAVSSSPEANAERKPVPQPPIASGTAHILLADDSEDNRFLIAEYLKHSPYVIDFAENGEIALAKMKTGHYDLVLMDAHMPVMDGYVATRAMRAWELVRGSRPVPILALTADAFKEAVEQSVAAGFNAHLTKPISKPTLLDAIQRYALPCDQPTSATTNAPPVEPSIAAMAPRYLKNMEKSLKELRAAEATQDYATIQRIGHNLHGTGGSFGFPLITEFGTAMEQAAKDRDIGQIRSAVLQFGSYLEQLLAGG